MTDYEREAPAPRGDQFLDGIDYELIQPEPTSPRTALIVEIAIRIQELHDMDSRLCFKFLHKLLQIYQTHPGSFRLVLDVLAGNAIGDVSLSVLADMKPGGYSKQNFHQTEQRRLDELAEKLPEVAKALQDIRKRAEKPKKP